MIRRLFARLLATHRMTADERTARAIAEQRGLGIVVSREAIHLEAPGGMWFAGTAGPLIRVTSWPDACQRADTARLVLSRSGV